MFVLAAALPAVAQMGMGREVQYGEPVEVELEDIARGGRQYHQKAVRTLGTLDRLGGDTLFYRLREGGAELLVIPVPQIASELWTMTGREVEVTGLVRELYERQSVSPGCGPDSLCEDPFLPPTPDRQGHPDYPPVSITVWGITDMTPPPGTERKGPAAAEVSLEDLVTRPGRHDGKRVRVVGQFRGRNLYGDLPSRSQRTTRDWVVKIDLFAVWVTGRKPKGSGFELDPTLRRDTGKWLAVEGTPTTRNGIVYVQAQAVSLTAAPSATARVEPPPPPPEKPKVPPVVVFALPLDGEAEIAPETRFVVQFSKDMDEASFQGRVLLRYVGPVRPGDRALDSVKVSYDGGLRALTVDPGDVLRPGRQVELVLLPGITDVDGLALVPRTGEASAGVADVLRFVVSG
jgi:hypothetical protein